MKFKVTDIKSIPAMSFKRTCALNTIFNKSLRIHFVSGKILFTWKPHAGLKFHFVQNDRYKIHVILSFVLSQLTWTQVKSWLNTEVRFSNKMKSHTGLSLFLLSCERTLIQSGHALVWNACFSSQWSSFKFCQTFIIAFLCCTSWASVQRNSSKWQEVSLQG